MANTALLVIMLVSIFLAWHPKYEDGLTGRLSLGGIVLMIVIILVGEWRGIVSYQLPGEVEWLFAFIAIFALRHAYRFVLWAYWGKHSWKAGQKLGDCSECTLPGLLGLSKDTPLPVKKEQSVV